VVRSGHASSLGRQTCHLVHYLHLKNSTKQLQNSIELFSNHLNSDQIPLNLIQIRLNFSTLKCDLYYVLQHLVSLEGSRTIKKWISAGLGSPVKACPRAANLSPVKDGACSADTGAASSPGASRVATGTCPLADDASTNLYWL
jgi:hypothetical protein